MRGSFYTNQPHDPNVEPYPQEVRAEIRQILLGGGDIAKVDKVNDSTYIISYTPSGLAHKVVTL